MLRAILSNRLSTNNEAKENRTLHKTPSKKALNKTSKFYYFYLFIIIIIVFFKILKMFEIIS